MGHQHFCKILFQNKEHLSHLTLWKHAVLLRLTVFNLRPTPHCGSAIMQYTLDIEVNGMTGHSIRIPIQFLSKSQFT